MLFLLYTNCVIIIIALYLERGNLVLFIFVFSEPFIYLACSKFSKTVYEMKEIQQPLNFVFSAKPMLNCDCNRNYLYNDIFIAFLKFKYAMYK